MGRLIVCAGCNNDKEHYAHELCRQCYDRRRYEANSEEMRADSRRYYKENQEERIAYSRHYRKERPDYQRQYYQEHREKKAIQGRHYREKHRKAIATRISRWTQDNPDKVAAKHARRRANKLAVANTLTPEQLEFERAVGEATYPGEKLDLHHIVPFSKGGGHTWGNIIFIPSSLNRSVNDKLPEEVYKQEVLA